MFVQRKFNNVAIITNENDYPALIKELGKIKGRQV